MREITTVFVFWCSLVWASLGMILIIIILASPQLPCDSHHHQTSFLGTTYCQKN